MTRITAIIPYHSPIFFVIGHQTAKQRRPCRCLLFRLFRTRAMSHRRQVHVNTRAGEKERPWPHSPEMSKAAYRSKLLRLLLAGHTMLCTRPRKWHPWARRPGPKGRTSRYATPSVHHLDQSFLFSSNKQCETKVTEAPLPCFNLNTLIGRRRLC